MTYHDSRQRQWRTNEGNGRNIMGFEPSPSIDEMPARSVK